MKFDLSKILLWSARIFSVLVVVVWLIGLLFFYGSGNYFIIGLMIWLILILTSLIAWKSDPFGGVIFILLGSVYLVVAMGNQFSLGLLLAAAPLFITGSLFIIHYVYNERMKDKEEDDF